MTQKQKGKPECRFILELPFEEGFKFLSHSKVNAIKKFLSAERTLHKDTELYRKYSAFNQDFLSLSHMENFIPRELDKHPYFLLPHRCVAKDDSTKTKLRVVFDASAKTTSGLSLNDYLMVGPKLQGDLSDILICFKCFKVAMSADVAKLYRQVSLAKEDKDFCRVLWRFDDTQPVDIYRTMRCTYGITNSSMNRFAL